MKEITIGAALALVVAAGAATALKSDPDNYYLDPDEIRPIIRLNLEHDFETELRRLSSPFYGAEVFDVRLIPGQVPVYTIDGYLAGYLYVACVLPGELPTYADIIAKPDYYDGACNFVFVGVNGRCPECKGGFGLPALIKNQKLAESVARTYYGDNAFQLSRYIYRSYIDGYEFTDGRENIIVPLTAIVDDAECAEPLPRRDIDKNTEEYIKPPRPFEAEAYFGIWSKWLRDYYSE